MSGPSTQLSSSKMLSKIFKAVIMGPPGSGKGTISEWIVRDFALKHVSCGELMRQHIGNKTELGQEFSKYIVKGQLVPDEVVTKFMLSELKSSFKDQNWLLDGFPRTVPQAETLLNGESLSCVVNLDVPEEEIIERIKGRWIHAPSGRTYHTQFNPPKVPGKDDITGEDLVQRDDDKEETVRARLETYREQTEPVLAYFRGTNCLQEFQGRRSKEIYPHVYKFLSTLRKPVKPLEV